MNKKRIKEVLILLLVILVTLSTNYFYKRQYIKSVTAQSHYDYTLSATQLDMKLGSIFSIYADGNDAPKVKWYSSDTNVARINSFGQVIATNVGQTIITAKYKNQCEDMIINVYKNAKQDVLIYKDSTTIATFGESLNKININKYILTISKNKYKYTGKRIKPKASITSTDGHKLVRNKDYTVKYQNNKKAGKAQVLVRGIGDYTGSLVGTFIIGKPNEDATMDPSNNSNSENENSDSETQSETSNKTTVSRSTNVSTSSLTPTSPEKSRISSTRTQSYKSSSKKPNASKKSNTSTKNKSSNKDKQKSSTKKENTKNSFTKSDSSTTHNSFEKSATNTTDNTTSETSKDSSNSNSSSTNTDSSNNSTDSSSSSNTTTDSTNNNTTESTSN